MSFAIVLTVMAVTMTGPARIVESHVVNERFTDEQKCLSVLISHMNTRILPGHAWAGFQPHPNGQFKQCR